MADQIEISLPKTKVAEGSVFTATAYFRTRSTSAASTPSTVRYRIECLTTGRTVLDWTSATAASSVSISMLPAYSAIKNDCNDQEVKQLLVEADAGLSTQCRGRVTWTVENLYGVE